MLLRGSSAGRTCSYKHVFSFRPNPGTTVWLRTHARARALFLSLPPHLSLSHTHTYARACSRMLTYGGVSRRMVAYGRVFAVWRCEARHGSVSLSNYRLLQYISPPLHSYHFLDITYRLRHRYRLRHIRYRLRR